MDEKLIDLKNKYDIFLEKRFTSVQVTQDLFNSYTSYSGTSPGSWTCGGCIRRCMDKTEKILKNNNLI